MLLGATGSAMAAVRARRALAVRKRSDGRAVYPGLWRAARSWPARTYSHFAPGRVLLRPPSRTPAASTIRYRSDQTARGRVKAVVEAARRECLAHSVTSLSGGRGTLALRFQRPVGQ